MSSVPIRLAARVLLVDEQQRLLLLRSVDPADGSMFWFPPGGGIEPGEDATAAAVREVWEETGLQNCPLEGEVWRRRHLFTWGSRTYDQHEHWFLARVSHFEPAPGALTVAEQQEITEFRWWTLTDMDATTDLMTPRALPDLLRALLISGIPAEPLDVSV
jgi:8-oxo-dGTP pyrophosphatase MutT (NUDIX family)